MAVQGTGGAEISAHENTGAPWGLSGREVQVIKGRMRGLTYKQVGQELGIAESTVRTHIHSALRKMEVADGIELAVKWVRGVEQAQLRHAYAKLRERELRRRREYEAWRQKRAA